MDREILFYVKSFLWAKFYFEHNVYKILFEKGERCVKAYMILYILHL